MLFFKTLFNHLNTGFYEKGVLISPPAGYAFLTDANGVYLTDASGNYLYGAI